MHADTATIVGLVTPVNLRFVVPVYQRPYTWDIKQCAQLWDDVLSVGRAAQEARMRSAYGSREVPTYHFTGSIVWIQDGAVSPAGVESRLLIDGQQRITTLMLVFVALVRYAQRHPENYPLLTGRVAGFSVLFTTVDEMLQNDIISRTEHDSGGML